jgi:hypothetical protein
MPDFSIIKGGGPDKEEREKQEREREQQRTREWTERDVTGAICEVAANILRIIRGAGKPYSLLLEMKRTIDAAVKFQEAHGYWPDHVMANTLRLEPEHERILKGHKEGRFGQEVVDHWMADDKFEKTMAEYAIQCGALQIIASDLLGQIPQRAAGDREFHEGLFAWADKREERRRNQQDVAKAAARAANPKGKPRSGRRPVKL